MPRTLQGVTGVGNSAASKACPPLPCDASGGSLNAGRGRKTINQCFPKNVNPHGYCDRAMPLNQKPKTAPFPNGTIGMRSSMRAWYAQEARRSLPFGAFARPWNRIYMVRKKPAKRAALRRQYARC